MKILPQYKAHRLSEISERNFLFILLAIIIFLFADFCLGDDDNSARTPKQGKSNFQYELKVEDASIVDSVEPQLPDLSGYNIETVIQRKLELGQKNQGKIIVDKMFGSDVLHDFTSGERATEWAKRQTSFPKSIYISQGYVTLKDLDMVLSNPKYFARLNDGSCIVRLPVVVENSGILDTNGDYCTQLKFSQDHGAFIAVAGTAFILNTEIIAWNEKANRQAFYEEKDIFRPFLVSWTGSKLYIVNSVVKSFGYHKSKSYGISVSNYSDVILHRWDETHPLAWLIESRFEDMYYGFYCYNSDNIVLVRNKYMDNIVYGIDPHDYSDNLIIAHNEVIGTKEKHGIIISREVNNSWIFNNKSHENKLSGIVLDRMSQDNVVAYNVSMNNGSDGITIYESSNNVMYKNQVLVNNKHGIRARNSTGIVLQENKVVGNGSFGVYGHIKSLEGTDRDVDSDPYSKEVSLTLNGDVIAANSRGAVHIDNQIKIVMHNLDVRFARDGYKTYFSGSLGKFHNQILETLLLQKKVAVIQPVLNPVLQRGSI